MASRSYNFSFTWNNHTDASIEVLTALKCKYMCYGKEVGDSGTPHLQGVVVFDNATTDTSLRKKLKGAHIEVCKGSVQQNQVYCKKQDDWTERGVAPTTKQEQGDCGRKHFEELAEYAKKPPTAGAAHVDAAHVDNGARGRAAREGMEPDEYYRLHSHLHPPESVLKQFDKHPLAVQVRQSHSV